MARILLVDDDAATRRLVRLLLVAAGHHVTEAEDGAEAERIIFAERPDLLIIDLIMPNKTGWEVIRDVRGTFPTLRILAVSAGMSGIHQDDYLVAAKRDGADAALPKPINPPELLAAVAKLVADVN